MRIFILLQLVFILLSCDRRDPFESKRKRVVVTLEAEKLKEKKRAREERLAKIPPFVDLGDTLNYTDENGWKQGIWEYRGDGLKKVKIIPVRKSEGLQLDGTVQMVRQYYNDTLHGIFESYKMCDDFGLCIKGTYILGKKDGQWEFPCQGKDSIFESVYDVD